MPSCRGQEKGGPRWTPSFETRKDRGYHRPALLAIDRARPRKKGIKNRLRPASLCSFISPAQELDSIVHRALRSSWSEPLTARTRRCWKQHRMRADEHPPREQQGSQREVERAGRLGQVRRVKWSRDADEQCSAMAIAAPDIGEALFRLPATASMPRPHPPRLRRPAKSDLALDFRLLEIRSRLLASLRLSFGLLHGDLVTVRIGRFIVGTPDRQAAE